jgi:hypothetical protein
MPISSPPVGSNRGFIRGQYDRSPVRRILSGNEEDDVMSEVVGEIGRCSSRGPSRATLFWACVLSALAPLCLGFFGAGWVTAGEAHRMAAFAVAKARSELATDVCFHRFLASPDAVAHLAALRETDPWARGDLLVRDGWTAIPGTSKDDNAFSDGAYVGDTCAQRLMAATPRPQGGTTTR